MPIIFFFQCFPSEGGRFPLSIRIKVIHEVDGENQNGHGNKNRRKHDANPQEYNHRGDDAQLKSCMRFRIQLTYQIKTQGFDKYHQDQQIG